MSNKNISIWGTRLKLDHGKSIIAKHPHCQNSEQWTILFTFYHALWPYWSLLVCCSWTVPISTTEDKNFYKNCQKYVLTNFNSLIFVLGLLQQAGNQPLGVKLFATLTLCICITYASVCSCKIEVNFRIYKARIWPQRKIIFYYPCIGPKMCDVPKIYYFKWSSLYFTVA